MSLVREVGRAAAPALHNGDGLGAQLCAPTHGDGRRGSGGFGSKLPKQQNAARRRHILVPID